MKKSLLFWLTIIPFSTIVFLIGKITGSKSLYFPIIELILFTVQISAFLILLHKSKKELKALEKELKEASEQYEELTKKVNQNNIAINNKMKP